MNAWTFEQYWDAVLGARDADQVVREFDLDPSNFDGVAEWLASAERAALDGEHEPDEWRAFHDDALDALTEASVTIVIRTGIAAMEGFHPERSRDWHKALASAMRERWPRADVTVECDRDTETLEVLAMFSARKEDDARITKEAQNLAMRAWERWCVEQMEGDLTE